MSFLTDILVGVLSVYLALTNTLSEKILEFLPQEQKHVVYETIEAVSVEKAPIPLVPDYERGGTLPNILIENAAYQGAAVIDSSEKESAATKNPLDAVVNLFCSHKNGDYIRTNSGSGFFVSPDGVIMTNAHVAQFLLLENAYDEGESSCVVRAGSPAEPLYEVELLYISPAWIQEHAHLITSSNPKGTGERDFALLYVTKGLENRPLPAHFPYLAVDTELLRKEQIGSSVMIAGFPAGEPEVFESSTELSAQTASSSITQMYTFVSNYADVIALASSTVGKFGVSGGPVLNPEGEVIGIVSTKGSPEEGTNTLRALTLSYVDRTVIEESTFTLSETMSGHLAFRAQLFMETIVPFLSRVLEAEL